MNQIQGVYVGKQIWGSSFQNGEFFDEIIDLVSAKSCRSEYVTSDMNQIAGNSEKTVALAYYSYSEMVRRGKKQERVYEIICGDDCIELSVFEGIEDKSAKEVLRQKEKTAKEDSEKIIIGKWVLKQFCEHYPDDEKIKRLKKELDDVEYGFLVDDEVEMSSNLDEFLVQLCEQTCFDGENREIILDNKRIVISKSQFENEVSEDLVEKYVPLIKKAVSRINNNLGKGDIVYIYAKDRIYNDLFAGEINHIANDNCISIVIEPNEEKKVSRGNAYLYYIKNIVSLNKIKENLGRYVINYYGETLLLDSEMGDVSFKCINDFSGGYSFKIIDCVSKKVYDVIFLCPFSISGNKVDVRYCFEATGLKLVFKDVETNEEYQKTIGYNI